MYRSEGYHWVAALATLIRPAYNAAISSELGMRPLMERVLSRRDILKA